MSITRAEGREEDWGSAGERLEMGQRRSGGVGQRAGELWPERESPTSAVTTTRSAAAAADCDCCSNKADSCHKHLLLIMTHMDTHTHTPLLLRCHSLLSCFMALWYLSCSCAPIRLRPPWLPCALCKVWQLNHSSNQDVPSSRRNTWALSWTLSLLGCSSVFTP